VGGSVPIGIGRFRLLVHGMTGGRRDFASVRGMEASQYDLQVDQEVADEATRLLGEQPARS
jgi:hypothetical protein